jgi:hypothetical protein
MNTIHTTEGPSTLFHRIVTSLRPRPRNLLDRRYLSDHFQRDIGWLDGHAPGGVVR